MDELPLWQKIEFLKRPGSRRLELGGTFLELRQLYSERERSADSPPKSGHGTFERECIDRGWRPRTVRELISDYEIEFARSSGRPTGEKTSAEKRRESRHSRRSAQRRAHQVEVFVYTDHPLTSFAKLLPYEAALSAFRAAAKMLHPDLGGSHQLMQELNAAWSEAQKFYREPEGNHPHSVCDENR
jgi:hypothetical protein